MRSLVLGLVASAALLLVPSAALAHASIESSDPADGAELAALPQTVSITLTEEVGETAILRVLDSSGTRVDDGDVTVAGRRVLVGVEGGQDDQTGAYRVAYRVVSADGHAVTGEIPFTVAPEAAAPDTSPSPDASPSAAGSGQDDVTVTNVEDDPSQKWAPFWVLGFLVVSSALILYIVRAGLGSTSAEDEDD